MSDDLVAHASVHVKAPPARVWESLTDPSVIKQYMFGTTVASTWVEGAPITWAGEWKGKPYQDKGVILEFKPPRRIQYSHFSPLSGLADMPENYHTVTIELASEAEFTHVSLSQDKNASEEARDHSQKLWEDMLAALKELLER